MRETQWHARRAGPLLFLHNRLLQRGERVLAVPAPGGTRSGRYGRIGRADASGVTECGVILLPFAKFLAHYINLSDALKSLRSNKVFNTSAG